MASHLVIIDSTARRQTVKTLPNTYLNDVLQEACLKFSLEPANYTLKQQNGKQVDLSRMIRHTGLTSGAKLNLVHSSRSPSAVLVALQVPNPPGSSTPSSRLTNKLASNTTCWQLLRFFETGADEGGTSSRPKHNFTQRAVPTSANGTGSGAGRLFYEMPVLTLMGRELSDFNALQKSLAQLGINDGSALFKLDFKPTEQPLEEAMDQISRYFQDKQDVPSLKPNMPVDSSNSETEIVQNPAAAVEASTGVPTSTQLADTDDKTAETSNDQIQPGVSNTIQSIAAQSPPPDVAIFAPPSSSTPAAVKQGFNEADYVPTIEHAQSHQARLNHESRNKKLLSDAEIEAHRRSQIATLSEVKSVLVRIRFPDQSQAQKSFDQNSTVQDLYDLCSELMNRPRNESFSIRAPGDRGGLRHLQPSTDKLIADLGWQGRVLITVVWDDEVTAETRRMPVLREEYRQQAQQLQFETSPSPFNDGDLITDSKKLENTDEKPDKGKGADIESKMRKFLGMGGRKK